MASIPEQPCNHQFVLIEQVTKGNSTQTNSSSTADNVIVPIRDVYGAKSGCVLCGQIRTVWADGIVSIDIPGNG